MKYTTPKYELAVLESNDVITTSEAYKVEQNGVSGSVEVSAGKIF